MKSFIIKLVSITLILSLFLVPNPSLAEESIIKVPTPEIPIYLKLNEFFILYTIPQSPFIDKNNRLLIPLQSIEGIMGGTVSYDSELVTAKINWLGHTYQVTIDSNEAKVDGVEVKMDTTPVLIKNSMFVPIRILIDSADIDIEWSQKYRLLTLRGENIDSGRVINDFKGQDFTNVKDENALNLISYRFIKDKNEDTMLVIKGKNISGHKIEHGKSDIHPIAVYKDGFSGDAYTRPLYPELEAVENEEIITKSQYFDVHGSFRGNILYVISVGRELE